MGFNNPSNYTPVNYGGNAPIINSKPFPTFDKPSPAPSTTVSYNPAPGPMGDAPIATRPFPDLQGPSSGGGLSFTTSFGGGGSGGQYSSVPSNVLNTRQFAPYESTYTPPTPATPVPYNYATRSPYTYGEGLSNAGAAYDIWGSKPGTNPYRLTTPDSYTPGILGLDPITLPGNMTNKGADISSLSNVKQQDSRTPAQQQWDRIAAYASQEALPKQELKMASDQYAARYGNEIFNNDKAKLAQMFPETNWDNFATPELRAANQVTSFPKLTGSNTSKMARDAAKASAAARMKSSATSGMLGKPEARAITSKMDRDNSTPAKTYTAKKASTKAAVKNYTTKTINNSFSARRDVRNLFA